MGTSDPTVNVAPGGTRGLARVDHESLRVARAIRVKPACSAAAHRSTRHRPDVVVTSGVESGCAGHLFSVAPFPVHFVRNEHLATVVVAAGTSVVIPFYGTVAWG